MIFKSKQVAAWHFWDEGTRRFVNLDGRLRLGIEPRFLGDRRRWTSLASTVAVIMRAVEILALVTHVIYDLLNTVICGEPL